MWGKFKGIQPDFPNTWLFQGLSSIFGRGSGRGKRMTDFYFAIFYATEKGSSFTKNSTGRNDLQFGNAFSFLWYHSCGSGKRSVDPKSYWLFSASSRIYLGNYAPHPKPLIFKRHSERSGSTAFGSRTGVQVILTIDNKCHWATWYMETAQAWEKLKTERYRPKERWMAACYNQLVTVIGIFLLGPAPWSLKSVYVLLGFAGGLNSVSDSRHWVNEYLNSVSDSSEHLISGLPGSLSLRSTHKCCGSVPWALRSSLARVRELQESHTNEQHQQQTELTNRRMQWVAEDNRLFSIGTKLSLFPIKLPPK